MAIRMPSWSDEDRKAFGVYRVRPVEVPSGKRVRYRQLKRVDDEVVEVGEFYDAPSRGVWVDRIKK